MHSALGQGEESTQSVCIALRASEPGSRPRKCLACLLCSVTFMIGTLTSKPSKKPQLHFCRHGSGVCLKSCGAKHSPPRRACCGGDSSGHVSGFVLCKRLRHCSHTSGALSLSALFIGWWDLALSPLLWLYIKSAYIEINCISVSSVWFVKTAFPGFGRTKL